MKQSLLGTSHLALHRLGYGRSKISLLSEFMNIKQLPGQSITSYCDDMASALGDPNTPDTFSRGEILSMIFIANMYVASDQFPLKQILALHPSGRIADSKGLMDRFEAYYVTRIALGASDKPSPQMSYTASTTVQSSGCLLRRASYHSPPAEAQVLRCTLITLHQRWLESLS